MKLFKVTIKARVQKDLAIEKTMKAETAGEALDDAIEAFTAEHEWDVMSLVSAAVKEAV